MNNKIKLYKTRRDVSVTAVQFDGTNVEEIKKLNDFFTASIADGQELEIGTTFSDGYMHVGDYLVKINDSIILMKESTFNYMFTKGRK